MNTKKVLISIILVMLVISFFSFSKTYAVSNIIDDGNGFLSAGDKPEDVINTAQLNTTNTTIFNILLSIGVAVAVIIGAVLGIQFIFGSVEGKAKISEALVPYIVGCFVVFGAFGIWKFTIKMGQGISDEKITKIEAGEGHLETFKCKTCGVDIDLDSGKVRALQHGQVTLTCKNGHRDKYP